MKVPITKKNMKVSIVDSKVKSKSKGTGSDGAHHPKIAKICLSCPTPNKRCKGICDYFRTLKNKILKEEGGQI